MFYPPLGFQDNILLDSPSQSLCKFLFISWPQNTGVLQCFSLWTLDFTSICFLSDLYPLSRFLSPIYTSFLRSRFLYTTANSSFLFEHLIWMSNLLCPKLSSCHSFPHSHCFFLIAPQLIKWQLQFFQLLSQKPYNHPWLHSSSHTQHVIH